MIFGIDITRDISKLSQTYNNFEITLVEFMPNITINHAITHTNFDNLLLLFGVCLTNQNEASIIDH